MISGNPDERLAFVIETEARLDGIRGARGEMAGMGGDADALAGRLSQMSAKSKAAFDAMTAAEKQAYLGFIGVGQGAAAATTALNTNAASATRTAAALSTTGQVALRVNAATAQSFDPISNKARTAANAMSTLSFAAAGLTSGGMGSVVAMGTLASSLAHLSSSARLAASASGIGAIVVVAATLIPLLMRLGGETERVSGGFRKAFGSGGDETAGLFLQLARGRRAVAQAAYENAPSLSMGGDLVQLVKERSNRKKALDEAVADEQAAIEAVFAARKTARNRAREEAKQEAEDRKRDRARTNDMYFAVTNERVQAEMRGSGNLEGADIESAKIERVNRELEINELKISDAEKADLRARNVEASEARITEIQNRYADERIRKYDEEARKQEDLDKRKARKRLSIARENVHALVMAEGSILQTMKRLALEPIVNRLEGIAAQQAVESLASAAALDFRGAAMHAAAAAAAIVAARTVAGWAGGGSKGGGGTGAGSGGGSGPGSFEPRSSTAGQGTQVINLYSMNPYGPELIQQVKYSLERADVMKRRGIEIPATTGLKVA